LIAWSISSEVVGWRRKKQPSGDMSLPTLDGLTATAAIRQLEELCDVPVIACSAHDVQDWADKALAARWNEFVSKPVDFAALENALKWLLP
jgi:CheY-like chemotaxis protein